MWVNIFDAFLSSFIVWGLLQLMGLREHGKISNMMFEKWLRAAKAGSVAEYEKWESLADKYQPRLQLALYFLTNKEFKKAIHDLEEEAMSEEARNV